MSERLLIISADRLAGRSSAAVWRHHEAADHLAGRLRNKLSVITSKAIGESAAALASKRRTAEQTRGQTIRALWRRQRRRQRHPIDAEQTSAGFYCPKATTKSRPSKLPALPALRTDFGAQ